MTILNNMVTSNHLHLLVVDTGKRDVIEGGEQYHLREEAAPYMTLFTAEKYDIGPENAYFWCVNTG